MSLPIVCPECGRNWPVADCWGHMGDTCPQYEERTPEELDDLQRESDAWRERMRREREEAKRP